jgi:integrase
MKKNVKFDLYAQNSECKPIRVRISYSGHRIDLRIGYSIEPVHWDSNNMCVKAGAKNKFKQTASEINKAILNASNCIDEIFTTYEILKKRAPTPEELKNDFYSKTGKHNNRYDNFFFEVYDKFTATNGINNNWVRGTYQKFAALKQHLITFDKKISLLNISEETMQHFVSYLQKQGLRNTSIDKQISFVRWFLRWCYKQGYYTGSLHDTFRPKLKGTDGQSKEIIYLSWEELMRFYYFDFENKLYLKHVRDVFCFCCFTGLRYSDVAKLRRNDIFQEHIRVVTQKTNESLIIELNDYSREILKQYENTKFKNSLALPVISNVKMNLYLKEAGKIIKLVTPQRIVYFRGNNRIEKVYSKYELLTTHCARRTFVVNALRIGIPAEVIMKWTGHSDHKSMKPYMKIVDELKTVEMAKFNSFGKDATQNETRFPK